MKPGRNDPCPCGSGKKYKKCCYHTDRTPYVVEDLTPRIISSTQNGHETHYVAQKGNTEGSRFDNNGYMHSVFTNIRRFLLDEKPHIKEYYKIRNMHSDIVSAMLQFHYDGKFKQEIDPHYAPQDERSSTTATMANSERVLELVEAKFDTDTREGEHALFDMFVYKTAPNMNCITEVFISKNRYRKPEKIEFLQSMLNSRLGLFEVTETDFDEGYAYIREVFTGDKYKLTDLGLSGQSHSDKHYIYTRVITYRGTSFSTGLNLVFEKTDRFVKDHIRHHKSSYSKNGELTRFLQLFNHFSENPERVKTVTNTF